MSKSYLKVLAKGSFLIFFLAASISGCAYRLGSPDRSLPGGYRQVFIPIFKNKSMEPGIEVPFTNALIQEYERAKIARVTDSNQAEVVAEGVIESVAISKTGSDITGEINTSLPTGTVQATSYQILIVVELTLKRNSDKSILWTGRFNGERTFNAAQIAAVGVNTANPLYNHSARRINMEQMAAEMMSEAHDRSTENF